MRPIIDRTAASDARTLVPGSGGAASNGELAVLWRRRSKWLAGVGPVVAAIAVGVAAVISGAAGGPATAGAQTAPLASSTTPTGTVRAARASGVGTVLVDSAGRTLYLFGPDKQKKVTCTGPCARFWPPLDVTGKPRAGSGVRASLLGTIKAPNGATQVTYDHWPLYTFAGDSKAGQANGQGVTAFGGTWFALKPSGSRATAAAPPVASKTTTTLSYP